MALVYGFMVLVDGCMVWVDGCTMVVDGQKVGDDKGVLANAVNGTVVDTTWGRISGMTGKDSSLVRGSRRSTIFFSGGRSAILPPLRLAVHGFSPFFPVPFPLSKVT